MSHVSSEATSIAAIDLTYVYQGSDSAAVSKVNIDVQPGQVVALVGPSGCGKSTLLRVISGLLNPSSGSLHFGNTDASLISPENRGVGWVPQSYALFDHLTVWENVAFGLRARKVPKDQTVDRVDEAIKMCEISDFSQRYPSELSGGQKQRVAIARALATKPKVLLLDEPLAALDPQLRKTLRVSLAALLRDSGVTSVLVTHDQTEALAMADKVAVMRGGEIQQFDTPQWLWQNPKNAFVAEFVGAAKVVHATRTNGGYEIAGALRIEGLAADRPTISVALRPGDLEIASDGTGAEFRILGHEYTGDKWLLTGEMTTNNEVITILADKHQEVGTLCAIKLRSEAKIAEVK